MRQLKSYSRFLILLLLLALPMTLRAVTFEIDGLRYYVYTDKMTAKVTGLTNTSIKNLIIPDKIDYNGAPVPVTSIGYQAFYGCSGLTSVTIGNSVTYIGWGAFNGCSGLKEVTIADGTENLSFEPDVFENVNIETLYLGRNFTCTAISSSNPFYGKTSLTKLTIGNSVTSIGEYAFDGCSGLTSVTIPNSVTSIGSYAFYGCSGLKEVTIPNSVTSIGSGAFEDCSGLKEVTIADGTERLSFGSSVFKNVNIETLYLGRNFTTDSYPFYGKTSLTKLTISNSVTYIGEEAFRGCSGLKEVTIADGTENLSFGPNVFGYVNIETLYLGRNFTCTYSNSSYCPFYGKTSLTKLTIGNSVTSIGEYAFYGCSGLKEVTIPNSVTSIGEYAFYGCSGLTSVTIPNSVTSIGYQAFYGCSGLTSVTIPNSVTSIGGSAFSGCSGLKEVTIADGTENLSFGSSVFKNVNIETLYLGRNFTCTVVSSSSGYPFYGKTSLTKLTIGNSVTSIGSKAFSSCSGLKEVTIPNSVTEIGSSAFYGCSGLKEVTIADGTENLSFGSYVFENVNIETLYLGRNYTCTASSSSYYPFYGKTSLTKLTIGNSVTEIGKSAFYGCSGLKEVTIADGTENLSFESDVFKNVNIETLYLGRNYTCTVSSSSGYPFYGRTSLTKLTISNSVTSIGESAFYGCSGLKEVTIADGTENLSFGSDVFKNVNIETLYLGRNFTCTASSSSDYPFYGKTSLTKLTISNSVTSIGKSAFYGCSGLTSVTIPNSVTEISAEAFYNCPIESISSRASVAPAINANSFSGSTKYNGQVSIPDGALDSYQKEWWMFKQFKTDITAENIYTVSSPGNLINQLPLDKVEEITSLKLIGKINGTDILFLNKCQNIHTLDLSQAEIVSGGMPYYEKDNERFSTENNILGQMWCYNLSDLTWLKLPETLAEFGKYSMRGKTNVLEINIPNSVTSIGGSAFSGCSGLTSVTIPNSVTSIGYNAFYGCSGLTSVTIPNSVTSIAQSTFYGCSGLKEVTIPNSVTSIGWWAFLGCSGLKEVTIPNSVTSIGEYAFHGCSGLTSVTIGNSVTSIGEYAFRYCSGLTSVTIPNSVTEIGLGTFEGCSGLTSVTIGNSVTSIDNYAFSGCSGLKEVTIADGTKRLSFGSYVFKNVNIETLYVGRNYTCTASYDGNYLFYRMTSLTKLTISNSVTSIDKSAFYGCSGLTSVTIGNSVTSIGSQAFYGCSGLTSVTIPNSVTYIGEEAFRGCSGLTSVVLPISINEIISSTFYGCSKLESINIPDPVQKIGSMAFSDCSALESIVLPGSLREIESSAFSNCPSIKYVTAINPIPSVIESSTFPSEIASATLRVPEGSRTLYWLHPYWGKFGSINTWGGGDTNFAIDNVGYQITSEIDRTVEVSSATLVGRASDIEIPATVTFNGVAYRVAGIANNGFENCNAATIKLPATIGYVGLEAFKGCSNLKTLDCRAMTPPSVDSNSFDQAAYSNVELLVPEAAVNAYNMHAVWSLFTQKVGEAPSIEIDADAPVSVYTLSGMCVLTDVPVDALDTLTPGIYIVRQGPSVKKIAIK